MSAHTKGPWEVVEHSWSRIGIYADGKGIAALDIYDEATPENEDALGGEMVANANLIAAAPELLEALKAMLGKAYKQNWNDNYPEQVKQAEEAIAKATGEQQ